MAKQRLFTKQDKQVALACFRAGMGPQTVTERLGYSYPTVRQWYESYLQNDNSWAKFDDESFTERQKALELFKQGYGYKKVAKALSVSVSRAKYWHLLYRHDHISFFNEGTRRPKRYSSEMRNEILNRFAVTTESKKAFCHNNGISVPTLNNWLKQEQSKKTD